MYRSCEVYAIMILFLEEFYRKILAAQVIIGTNSEFFKHSDAQGPHKAKNDRQPH